MKRISALFCFLLLLVGSFFFQTTTSFAASAHTKLQTAPMGIAGGNLVRAVWTSSDTLAFLTNDIDTGNGEIIVYSGGQVAGAAFFSIDSNGYGRGTMFVNGCYNMSARVFDGQAGTEFTQSVPSCSTFTPPPYGPDTCVNGYVWRQAYSSNDHVCVTTATRSQAAYDNSQAASRINPNGAYGPNTCINGYVWREASKGIDPTVSDLVCVTPATRSQAAYDNSQAVYRKLFLGF